MARILIIDDERSIRNTLREILEYEQYEVDEAVDGVEGLEKVSVNQYQLIFCDIKMPRMDGLEVLPELIKKNSDIPVIMISGHGTIETAVEATKLGAFDFIAKPLDLNRLLITVRNALDKQHLVKETKVLKQRVSKTQEILGISPGVQRIRETIERVAPTDARILITGENGTGKELVARWIHEKSNRAKGPLIEVNCAAIPSELIESELFGHEKGSFTSAIKQRIGKFEQANGGTLFLDEIGDMPIAAQAKVLRALQENKINRVGDNKDVAIEVRIVSATNKDLVKEIEENRFRLDLYHRLGVIIIHVPSLNDRKDDIPMLAEKFLDDIAKEYNMPEKRFSASALDAMKNYHWTGNIRELRNVVERLAILSGATITENDVHLYTSPMNLIHKLPVENEPSLSSIIKKHSDFQLFKDFMEKEFLVEKLKSNNWNVAKTAEILNMQRSHLYGKMEKFNIKRNDG